MGEYSVGETVYWKNGLWENGTYTCSGELITQPFPDFPDIWLIHKFFESELVLVSERYLYK